MRPQNASQLPSAAWKVARAPTWRLARWGRTQVSKPRGTASRDAAVALAGGGLGDTGAGTGLLAPAAHAFEACRPDSHPHFKRSAALLASARWVALRRAGVPQVRRSGSNSSFPRARARAPFRCPCTSRRGEHHLTFPLPPQKNTAAAAATVPASATAPFPPPLFLPFPPLRPPLPPCLPSLPPPPPSCLPPPLCPCCACHRHSHT